MAREDISQESYHLKTAVAAAKHTLESQNLTPLYIQFSRNDGEVWQHTEGQYYQAEEGSPDMFMGLLVLQVPSPDNTTRVLAGIEI